VPVRALGLRIATCVGLAAAAVAVAAPAVGEDLTRVDDVSDVRFYELPDRPGAPLVGTDVPGHRDGDLRRVWVRYSERRIRVVMRFRDLRRHEDVLLVQGHFRWGNRSGFEYGEAVIMATDQNRAGEARLTTRPRCEVRHKLWYDENRAALSFPATCIGSPRWVQFNPVTFTTDDYDAPSYVYVDSIYDVIDEDDDGEVQQFTRRIRRG
jgi:hypothetical protein